MDVYSKNILKIVEACNDNCTISELLDNATKIADMQNDFLNSFWLKLESINLSDSKSLDDLTKEIQPHLKKTHFNNFYGQCRNDYINERKIHLLDANNNLKEVSISSSVSEIESKIEGLQIHLNQLKIPKRSNPIDLYSKKINTDSKKNAINQHINELREILSKIRNRVTQYITQINNNILKGNIKSVSIEENKRFVDIELQKICASAYEKFIYVYNRLESAQNKDWAQTLLACRGLLKDFSDSIYPPAKKPVKTSDGKEKVLNDKMYKERLWQYVYENYQGDGIEIIKNELNYICSRVDSLYELSSIGVHGSIDKLEANQCIIYTYLLIGDILRIKMDLAEKKVQHLF